MADGEEESVVSNSEALLLTLMVYGGIFVCLLVVYCLARTRYKLVFTPRSELPKLSCRLATKRHTGLSWLLIDAQANDHDIFLQCGLDAVAFIRLLRLGAKVSLVACVTALFNMPVYFSTEEGDGNEGVTDPVDKMTIGNVNKNDPRMYGTLIAAYLIFGYAMYALYEEFDWYISMRHEYMSQASPQNYTVVVTGMFPEMRSKHALEAFFNRLFGEAVHEVQLVLEARELEAVVAARNRVSRKLEHASAVFQATGERPKHRATLTSSEATTDSIDVYTRDLDEANDKIVLCLKELQRVVDEHEAVCATDVKSGVLPLAEVPAIIKDAAFVSFKSLLSTQSALQMVHHATPFCCRVCPAAVPEDIFWENLGLSNARMQVMGLLTGAATWSICIFWTLPVSFVATFTKVDSLKERVEFIRDAADAAPWLEYALPLVSPAALVALTQGLRLLLAKCATLEGHIAKSSLQTSLFVKLTQILLIQTFFVSAIAGSLFDQLDRLISDPAGTIVEVLATSLPQQATTFTSYVLTRTFLDVMLELLRVVAVGTAALRNALAPKLTSAEREEVWMGLRPLSSPGGYDQVDMLSHAVLMFMVLFVYAVLAPISSFVMAFSFGFMSIAFTNQYIYVYEPCNDSGGQMWPMAVEFIIMCMLAAQVTIMGVMSLKEGPMSALVAPLLIVTILFLRYLKQQHFHLAACLPSQRCAQVDGQRAAQRFEYGFLREQYVPQAMAQAIAQSRLVCSAAVSEAAERPELPGGAPMPGGGEDASGPAPPEVENPPLAALRSPRGQPGGPGGGALFGLELPAPQGLDPCDVEV